MRAAIAETECIACWHACHHSRAGSVGNLGVPQSQAPCISVEYRNKNGRQSALFQKMPPIAPSVQPPFAPVSGGPDRSSIYRFCLSMSGVPQDGLVGSHFENLSSSAIARLLPIAGRPSCSQRLQPPTRADRQETAARLASYRDGALTATKFAGRGHWEKSISPTS